MPSPGTLEKLSCEVLASNSKEYQIQSLESLHYAIQSRIDNFTIQDGAGMRRTNTCFREKKCILTIGEYERLKSFSSGSPKLKFGAGKDHLLKVYLGGTKWMPGPRWALILTSMDEATRQLRPSLENLELTKNSEKLLTPFQNETLENEFQSSVERVSKVIKRNCSIYIYITNGKLVATTIK